MVNIWLLYVNLGLFRGHPLLRWKKKIFETEAKTQQTKHLFAVPKS